MKRISNKKTPKEAVLAQFRRAICEWNHAQMGYRIIVGKDIIGLGPGAAAAWRDALAQITPR